MLMCITCLKTILSPSPQVITSVNSSLKDINPTLITRRDTATLAALSLSHDGERQNGEHRIGLGEDEEEHETNIDSIFGKQETSSEDDSSSGLSSTSTPTHLMSPEPTDATEMELTEKVENEESTFGDAVVTTTVTVACTRSQECSPKPGAKTQPERGEEECTDTPTLTTDRPRTCSSTQILLNDQDQNVTLSVNLNGYDSDDTLSDEDSHPDLQTLQSEDFNNTQETKESSNEFKGEPPIKYAEQKENGVSKTPPSASPPRSPIIEIKEDRSGKGSTSSKGSHSSDEMSRLSPPTDKKRSSKLLYLAPPFL